ncbi:hypothetical protein IPH25_04290 [bacterium]|nr:MAG: hypothetical protein IPG37_01285 [bacterium]QQR61666.1 MAG: hypothetical protein IPH25_04290 [bacterium]
MKTAYFGYVETFIQFFKRDFLVHKTTFANDMINYGILWPVTFGLSFTVLRKNILFATQDIYFGSMILVGSVVVPMMVIAYRITFDLMFDLEGRRFILYQLSVLPVKLVLLQRMIFAACYTFLISSLMFPASLLFLKGHFVIENQAWLQLSFMLFLSSTAMAALQQLFAVILTVEKLHIFWVRVNGVLMSMAGSFIQTTPLLKVPVLGVLCFANPVFHIAESVRKILFPSLSTMHLPTMVGYLLATTLLSTGLTWYFFKKRIDHI